MLWRTNWAKLKGTSKEHSIAHQTLATLFCRQQCLELYIQKTTCLSSTLAARDHRCELSGGRRTPGTRFFGPEAEALILIVSCSLEMFSMQDIVKKIFVLTYPFWKTMFSFFLGGGGELCKRETTKHHKNRVFLAHLLNKQCFLPFSESCSAPLLDNFGHLVDDLGFSQRDMNMSEILEVTATLMHIHVFVGGCLFAFRSNGKGAWSKTSWVLSGLFVQKTF